MVGREDEGVWRLWRQSGEESWVQSYDLWEVQLAFLLPLRIVGECGGATVHTYTHHLPVPLPVHHPVHLPIHLPSCGVKTRFRKSAFIHQLTRRSPLTRRSSRRKTLMRTIATRARPASRGCLTRKRSIASSGRRPWAWPAWAEWTVCRSSTGMSGGR